ncbi:MAG: lipid-A-disaccharide synthase [Flavobacteriales bacterium]|nr:lipid-A-disaccharide synthase [Flavobacteriales bacterium]
MKYYIISGEASGDLHGANLMKALKIEDPNAEFRFWGGDLMAAQGGELIKHYRELAFMGFIEVVMNIRTISKNLKFCKSDVLDYQPDVLILVDYPGFNLRIAAFAKENGIPVHYYISPQVWAWKESRVKKIKRDVDQLYCILPFEKDFYKKHDYDVNFVGHPLIDAIANDELNPNFRKDNQLDDLPIIALLPGSRKQEITKMLQEMVKMQLHFKAYQFVIAGAPSQDLEFYQSLVGDDVKIVHNQTYDLLKNSEAALVTSGTATLETALFKVPEVVCYKGSWASYQIAKRLIKIKYISLVNLIMDQETVKELIQGDFNEGALKKELKTVINGGVKRKQMLLDFELLASKLGGAGASKRTAEMIVSALRK